MGNAGWLGEASKIRSWGMATAELRPAGQGITAGRGSVVVVVGGVVVEVVVGSVVVVTEVVVVVTEVVVVVAIVVVVDEAVVVLDGPAENAPAGAITMDAAATMLVSEIATTPRRRFHTALTASLYRGVHRVVGRFNGGRVGRTRTGSGSRPAWR